MKTPDEMKRGLQYCAEHARECGDGMCMQDNDAMCVWRCTFFVGAIEWAQRLEAELVATRERLKNHGNLCDICSNTAKMTEMFDSCDSVGHQCSKCSKKCFCKVCDDSNGKEGFEWVGGQQNE